MTDAKRPLKVFLCHASADKPKVRELYRTLKRRGVQPWLDAEDLIPGQNWEVEIPKALLSSDAIIICLTPNSVDKEGYVQKEIKFALDKAMEMPEGRIFIIPARLEDCELPFSLKKYQAVNLHEKTGYTKLMQALRLRASQLERATVELPKKGETTAEIKKVVEEKKTPEPKEEKPEFRTPRPTQDKVGVGGDVKDSVIVSGSGNVINIGEQKKTEPEKPQPRKTKPPSKPNTAIIVALIGLAGTIVAALLSSPLIENWFSPPPISSENATVTFTSDIQLVTPSETIEPSGTPTNINLPSTPTVTNTPVLDIGSESISSKDGIVLVYIPEGDFEMGYSSDAAYSLCVAIYNYCPKSSFSDIEPVKTIYLDDFWIYKTEVTNQMFKKCVDAGICQIPPAEDNDEYYGNDHFAGRTSYDSLEYADYPVVRVSWEEANQYCNWAGGRLPTEAEWEKTARGPNGNIYPWGNNLSGSDLYFAKQLGTLSSVGQFPNGSSFYGVLDLAGNVWEWTSDWYDASYYVQPVVENPQGPTSGQQKTIRGGYHDLFTTIAPSMIRTPAIPSLISNHVGFRCVHDVNP